MAYGSEQEFMVHLQINPPAVIDAAAQLIEWMRSVFGEPEWSCNKECNANIRIDGYVIFGVCAGRFPDAPSKNRALLGFRKPPGYEELVEKLKAVSPKVAEIAAVKKELQGFGLHLDLIGSSQELQMLKNILEEHVLGFSKYLPDKRHNNNESALSIDYLPSRDDFENACRMISLPGEAVPIDSV